MSRVAVPDYEMSLYHSRTVKPFGSQVEKVEERARGEVT